jgi:hypothetical protein
MKKQITTIVLGILMMAGAMAMYGGESVSFETNMTAPVYTVVGNSSNLEGLNVTFENGNITISLVLNYKPDNFTLVFFDNETREVEKIIYRGGGGSRTKYVDKNVTVYVPEYIQKNVTEYITETEEIEVDKVIYQNNPNSFELWHVLTALLVGGLFIWAILSKKKEKTAEELMEEIEDDEEAY